MVSAKERYCLLGFYCLGVDFNETRRQLDSEETGLAVFLVSLSRISRLAGEGGRSYTFVSPSGSRRR